jgi:hypothetical protein
VRSRASGATIAGGSPRIRPKSQSWDADTRAPIEVNRFVNETPAVTYASGGSVAREWDQFPLSADAERPTLGSVAPASEAAAGYKPGMFDNLIPAPPPGFVIVDDAPWLKYAAADDAPWLKYAAAEAEAKRKTASAAGPSDWDQFPRVPPPPPGLGDRDRACEQHGGRNHKRGMRARNELVAPSDQRAEQGNAKHAAGLPRRVQHTRGDTRSRLIYTAEQRRGQGRH